MTIESAPRPWALLVEDDPSVALVVTDMLEELGYRVEGAASAAAAITLFSARAFDLVLSDIELAPGAMNGLELARALKGARPQGPVLLMTGNGDRAERAAREFPVLLKPFGLAQLGRAILGAASPPSAEDGH